MFVDMEAVTGPFTSCWKSAFEDWFVIFFFNEGIQSISLLESYMKFGSSNANDVYISQLKSQYFFLCS